MKSEHYANLQVTDFFQMMMLYMFPACSDMKYIIRTWGSSSKTLIQDQKSIFITVCNPSMLGPFQYLIT